jgi:hypothetical protein
MIINLTVFDESEICLAPKETHEDICSLQISRRSGRRLIDADLVKI